jgi:hypothetical protein
MTIWLRATRLLVKQVGGCKYKVHLIAKSGMLFTDSLGAYTAVRHVELYLSNEIAT